MIKQRGQIVADKILDTAERLFFKQGYNITGINQIIEEADIAKASLYKHFDSKTDLLIVYLQRTHQRWFERLDADVSKAIHPKEKLLILFDYHRERQLSNGFSGCRFIKANDEAGMSDVRVLAEIQKAEQHLKEYILDLVVNSGHRQLLTDNELTDLIFMMLDGGIVVASIFKHADELLSAKTLIQKLI
jgi:AcrR family transcriptional regulator